MFPHYLQCLPAESLVQHVLSHHHHHHHDEDEDGVSGHSTELSKCTPGANNSIPDCVPAPHKHRNYQLSERDLLHLCPVLLYGLANNSDGCIEPTVLGEIDSYKIQNQKDDILYG